MATVLSKMYGELAGYWPLISPAGNYVKEAAIWRDVLRRRLGPGRHSIFELGVGGGCNLSHLTSEFDAVAADISPQMIEQARKLNPGVEFHVGDMRTIRLGRTFKAVLIHDAISYMLSEDELRAAFATAAAHLEPGGVFVTLPDWFRETFQGPIVSHRTHTRGDVRFTYFEYIHDPDPADTTIEALYWYLIQEGGKLRVEEDRHTLGLFPMETWVSLIEEAGFDVEKVPYDVEGGHGAPLFLGVLGLPVGRP